MLCRSRCCKLPRASFCAQSLYQSALCCVHTGHSLYSTPSGQRASFALRPQVPKGKHQQWTKPHTPAHPLPVADNLGDCTAAARDARSPSLARGPSLVVPRPQILHDQVKVLLGQLDLVTLAGGNVCKGGSSVGKSTRVHRTPSPVIMFRIGFLSMLRDDHSDLS